MKELSLLVDTAAVRAVEYPTEILLHMISNGLRRVADAGGDVCTTNVTTEPGDIEGTVLLKIRMEDS